MSSITGVVNVDNTLTGVEDLFLDELDANTILLGGTDLQTTLTELQNQITTGGGYFQILLERNGAATSTAYFSCGANANAALFTYLPNCVIYGIAISYTGTITSPVDVAVILNSTTYTYVVPNGTNGAYTNYNLNISVSQGTTLQAKFGTNLGVGGGNYRISLFCRTSAVNGTNGTDGTNGQNVSFYTPTITQIVPSDTAYVNDTITTTTIGAQTTQYHQLDFGIKRGRNATFQVGTISSVGTGSPTLDLSQSTNANGDYVYTMNFGLQQGVQGDKGDKGDKGDTGSQAQSTLDAIAAAISASASAAAAGGFAAAAASSSASASASAAAASVNGAQAGAQAGADAANAVLNELDARVTTLEGEVDTLNDKTLYISTNGTQTNIGGSKTNITSTNGLETSTLVANNVITANEGLSVLSDSYFNGSILMGDTQPILTNIIRQRQYPANGDILIDAININLGSSFNDTINLQGDNINIITNTGAGITNFSCAIVDTDTQVLVEGSLQAKNLLITNNTTINNNLIIDENLTAGTEGEFNEHILHGTTFIQKIEAINNALPLTIGEDTTYLELTSNNVGIGNINEGIESVTLINNKNISIGETLANSVVNIGGANSKITCDGTTDTITMDTNEIIIDTTEFSIINGDITLGNALDLNTNVSIQNRNVNIATTQIGMTAPTLNLGTYNRTTTQVRGETIEILASETTSINGSNNLEIDATHITMGNAGGDVTINGATIDIGTAGILNTINIGNDYSIMNINAGIGQYINIADFVNQLGF